MSTPKILVFCVCGAALRRHRDARTCEQFPRQNFLRYFCASLSDSGESVAELRSSAIVRFHYAEAWQSFLRKCTANTLQVAGYKYNRFTPFCFLTLAGEMYSEETEGRERRKLHAGKYGCKQSVFNEICFAIALRLERASTGCTGEKSPEGVRVAASFMLFLLFSSHQEVPYHLSLRRSAVALMCILILASWERKCIKNVC